MSVIKADVLLAKVWSDNVGQVPAGRTGFPFVRQAEHPVFKQK
jgi:hypothetical protein